MINRILEKLEEKISECVSAKAEAALGMQEISESFYCGEQNAFEFAKIIVQNVVREHIANDNDLAVVSALPSLYPLQPFEEESVHRVVASASISPMDDRWIPLEKGVIPDECEEVDVTIEEINGDIYTSTAWLQDGAWVIKKTELKPKVIAWKPKDAPYQKGE